MLEIRTILHKVPGYVPTRRMAGKMLRNLRRAVRKPATPPPVPPASKNIVHGNEPEIRKLESKLNATRRELSKAQNRINALADILGETLYPNIKNEPFKSDQDRVWSTKHGFRYVVHHMGEDWKTTRVPFWKLILSSVEGCDSILEFGCNIGANLKAINYIHPDTQLTGIELNRFAVDQLQKESFCAVEQGSIVDRSLGRKFDMVFSRGVLIHINRDDLTSVFDNMVKHASKYIMFSEIFSEEPEPLQNYSERVTGGRGGEQYQFWENYPSAFQSRYPSWGLIKSGVGLEVDCKPKKGDLYWTIFKSPDLEE